MSVAPSRRGKGALVAALCIALGGCAITPRPFDAAEREKLAAETRQRMFEGQEQMAAPLTLAEATARAIKYQAEHRQKRMEEAASQAQLDVAQWDLLPKLMLNAGYSWRNNEAFGFGFTPGGTIATTPSASQERTHNTSSIGLAWNLLDFGVSYFKARRGRGASAAGSRPPACRDRAGDRQDPPHRIAQALAAGADCDAAPGPARP